METGLFVVQSSHKTPPRPALKATVFVVVCMILLALGGCDSHPSDGAVTCRANLGSVEILEVWNEDERLYIAGRVLHHCKTPSVMTLRFTFLDWNGQILEARDGAPMGTTPLAAVTPQEFEWSTPMIEGVDAVTAMVVRLAAAPREMPEGG